MKLKFPHFYLFLARFGGFWPRFTHFFRLFPWGQLTSLYMAIKLGQINRWCKFRMMATFMEVKGQQRSNIVNNDLWLPNLVRRFADTSLGWLWPSQRSKVSKGHNNKQFSIATKLVRRAAYASLGWLWPSWRSKVNRGQIPWIINALPIRYLVSRWGLRPKVCMHHFGCGMNWGILHDCEEKNETF